MIALFKYIIVIVCFGLIASVKLWMPSYEDDNYVEEIAEYVLEEQSGIDIDITPLSLEKNKGI